MLKTSDFEWTVRGIEESVKEDFGLQFKKTSFGKKAYVGEFKNKPVYLYLPIESSFNEGFYLDENAKEKEVFYISCNKIDEYLKNIEETIVNAESLEDLVYGLYFDTPSFCSKDDFKEECHDLHEFKVVTSHLYGDSFSNTYHFLQFNDYI